MIDLFRFIFGRKNIVIICALLFGILAGGYEVVKSTLNNSAIDAPIKKYEEEIQLSQNKLSSGESYEVELAKASFDYYYPIYEEYVLYSNNSIYMNLDGYSVPTCISLYKISEYCSDDKEYISDINEVDDIITIYNEQLSRDEFAEKIISEMGIDTEPQYLEELYSTYNSGLEIMTVKVVARSENECMTIMECLEHEISNIYDELNSNVPHNLEKIRTIYKTSFSSNIVANQKLVIDNINTIKNNMLTVPGTFTIDQRKYYAALISREKIYGVNGNDFDNLTNVTKPAFELNVSAITKKAILGGALGGLLVIFYYSIKYMYSPFLRRREDITEAYGVPFLGEINEYDDSEIVSLISNQIDILGRKNNIERVVLSASFIDEVVSNIIDKICLNLGAERSIAEECILQSTQSLKAAADYGNIILFERVGKSKYVDIEREIDVCKNNKINILGVVVIK